MHRHQQHKDIRKKKSKYNKKVCADVLMNVILTTITAAAAAAPTQHMTDADARAHVPRNQLLHHSTMCIVYNNDEPIGIAHSIMLEDRIRERETPTYSSSFREYIIRFLNILVDV